MFQEYREVHDAMEADPAVLRARKAIEEYRASLKKLEEPYRERMAEAREKIVGAVLLGKKSVTLFGIYARFSKGSPSRSWKSIAMTFKPSEELIGEHTKPGKPSVKVTVVEDWEGEP